MVVFPNAKINIGLRVVEKRNDGYHNIETIFFPIPIYDALEIIDDEKKAEEVEFVNSGLQVDTNNKDNLCVKAYHLLKQKYFLPNIKIQLLKSIPMGAGLGGGSADAAFTLLTLNKKYNLQLNENELINYSLQLGSDCPFFIVNQPCYATARGENLHKIDLDLSNYKLVIINPKIHISTAQAFKNITPKKTEHSLQYLINQPIELWKETIVNDFEAAAFLQYPFLQNIKETLYNHQAIYAAMSGTGSTFYGIFAKDFTETNFDFDENWLVKWLDL